MLPVKEVNMNTTKAVLALAVALAGIAVADSAFAQHRHRHHHHHGSRLAIGLSIGLPLAAYSYYHYPRYAYYPPYYVAPVVVLQQPPVYVEQFQPPAPAYWYFCAESRAYYPHVRECASGWQRVAPQPG